MALCPIDARTDLGRCFLPGLQLDIFEMTVITQSVAAHSGLHLSVLHNFRALLSTEELCLFFQSLVCRGVLGSDLL